MTDEPGEPDRKSSRAPASRGRIPPPPTIVLGYQPPQATKPHAGTRWRNYYKPIGLIVIGSVIEAGSAVLAHTNSPPLLPTLTAVLLTACANLALSVVLTLIAVWLVAMGRGFKLRPVWIAVLKLCGIATGPGAIASLVLSAGIGLPRLAFWMLMLISLALYYAVIDDLLQLEPPDTWAVLAAVLAMKVLAMFIAFGVILHAL